jgi:hypothetical protein
MAVLIASTTALSVAANTKSADQVAATYQNVGAGKLTLAAKASATGLYVTIIVGGVPIVNDLPIPFTGTAGTIDVSANVMASQVMRGGRVELYFRNTTGGALTVDSLLYYEPMRSK